jgi:hypothetical protein
MTSVITTVPHSIKSSAALVLLLVIGEGGHAAGTSQDADVQAVRGGTPSLVLTPQANRAVADAPKTESQTEMRLDAGRPVCTGVQIAAQAARVAACNSVHVTCSNAEKTLAPETCVIAKGQLR